MTCKTIALLDGDIFVFKAISSCVTEVPFETGEGMEYYFQVLNFSQAEEIVHAQIAEVQDTLKADEVVFTWTDYSGNWRNKVLPTYKENRKKWENFRPPALIKLKERIADQYESYMRPNLEADDCMGILATWKKYKPDYKKVIVSEDKDMQTIPCWLYNPAKDEEARLISEEEADLYFLSQALAGDVTDGYQGCPNVGMTTAKELLQSGEQWEEYEHEFKSGKRKGTTETRYRKTPSGSPWDIVVSCYAKAGLSEEAALQQARVARICRAEDFNFKKAEVKLWVP